MTQEEYLLLLEDTGTGGGPAPGTNQILWDDSDQMLWDDGDEIDWDS